MHVVILTVGSRGDVQPYVALGKGLQQTGCRVTLATEGSFAPFVQEHGLAFAPLRAEFLRLAQRPEGRAALAGKNSWHLMREVMPMLHQVMEDAWDAAQDADVLVYHPKVLAGYHIAEKLGIPAYLAMALPAYSPTRAFAQPALGGGSYGSLLNRLSYWFFLAAAQLPYRSLINTWRKERLGLAPFEDDLVLRGRPVPKLYAYSPQVLPRPADWDDSTYVTGCWFLDATSSWSPPAGLQAFLEAEPEPLYVGFGSMAGEDAERLTRLVLEAAHEAQQRLILSTGWGGLAAHELPGYAYGLEAAPHEWLFPHCAAVVHHGGAGTTGAGLRAGKPTLICPFFGDQPFWGRQVATLGVGPSPIPQKKLSVAKLAQAVHLLGTDSQMRARAEALGTKIRAEDGVARAVEVIVHDRL